MKIDLESSSLFMDSGEFLKALYCPLAMSWNAMPPTDRGSRICDSCSREVHDTSSMTDDELQNLLSVDPRACLMVSPTQANCTVIPRMQNKSVGADRRH